MTSLSSLVQSVLDLLSERDETLVVAESLTGGALGAAITSVPGASQVFLGGIISYQDDIKIKHLSVAPELIEDHGVVSAEVAEAMATGVLKSFGSTWAISTTGIAGPENMGGLKAGTVWIAISGPLSHSALLEIEGDREVVRNATVSSAIAAFERILSTRQ